MAVKAVVMIMMIMMMTTAVSGDLQPKEDPRTCGILVSAYIKCLLVRKGREAAP
jgi:hypothetical protein